MIHIAAERGGLSWDDGLEDILRGYPFGLLEAIDSKRRTGLHPFAIAAMIRNNDLSTVYSLLQQSVHVIVLVTSHSRRNMTI